MQTQLERRKAERRSIARDWANTAHFIEMVVTVALRLSLAEFRQPGRGRRPIAQARQLAIYLVHTRIGLSLAAAGRMFGRDRTTAAHACRAVEDRRDDRAYDTLVDALERAIDIWPTALGLERE